MAGLPSVMQAKKAEMAAVLPALEQTPKPKKPVPVSIVKKPEQKQEENKDDSKELDISQFAVEDDKQEVAEENTSTQTEQKPVIVEKKPDDEELSYKQKFASLQGNHQLIVEENRNLRDRLVILESKFDELNKKPSAPIQTKEEPSLELTKEEQEEYGAALPVLEKFFAKRERQIQNSVIKPLQDEIAALKKNTSDFSEKTTKEAKETRDATFLQQVKVSVKDFDSIVSSDKWKSFIATPLSPYTEQTVGAALADAIYNKYDLAKVVRVFNDFSKSQTTNMTDAFRGPSVSTASGELPDANAGKKPKLKWSEREKASLKFRKRQMSQDEFSKIAELYRVADQEGRVDYDK